LLTVVLVSAPRPEADGEIGGTKSSKGGAITGVPHAPFFLCHCGMFETLTEQLLSGVVVGLGH
jgi:hypothetical protein